MKITYGAWKILLFALIFAGGVFTAYRMLRKEKNYPPVYQPSQLNPRLVDSTLSAKTGDHQVADFRLFDQLGREVTVKDLRGKIYVTDFFFTTCQSICPKMTSQLVRVEKEFRSTDEFLIVSHTVDPEVDSIPVLKAYGELNGINPDKWRLLTGEQRQISDLARKSYFAVIDEPSQEGPDFIHTENFVLVDQLGRLRGFYDGTDSLEVDRLIADIRLLLEQMKQQ